MARPGSYARLWLALAGLLGLTGCAGLGELAPAADPLRERLATALDRDDWRPDPDWTPGGMSAFRWRFGGPPSRDALDAALAEWERRGEPREQEPPLLALSRRPDRVGRNAAILLARSDPPDSSAAVELAAVVTGEPPPEPTGEPWSIFRTGAAGKEKPAPVPEAVRAAAAEAWCRVLAAGDGPLEERLAAPGRAWQKTELPDSVRAELLRGLARHLPPERIVGYGELFTADATATFRRAAVEGCVLFAAAHPDRPFDDADWPPTIENAGLDIDAAVRRGYGRWLALSHHPDAVSRLVAQVQDADPGVAESAVASLGLLKTDDARDALRAVAKKPSEILRAAAAGALASWGPAEIKPLLADASPVVRRAAVAGAAKCPSPETAVLLDSVIADGDLDVQRRAVEATAGWPDELALPVFFSGLKTAAVRTRRECLDELRRRTDFAEPFPVTGDPEVRAKSLDELAAAHGWPLDAMTRFRLAVPAERGHEPTADVSPLLARLADPAATAAERESVLSKLKQSDASAASAVETFCLGHAGPIGDRLLTEVLPVVSPAHSAAAELGSGDVAVRRRGAGRLAELGRSATLSPLVLRRVRERLAVEEDGLVWRQVMAAVSADATPEAEQVALLALHSRLPDVRRLGCEYVGRHARPHQAEWLAPLVSDPDEAVRVAATEAIGRCGGPPVAPAAGVTIEALRTAAAGSDRAAQFAALAALARLGDESGGAALLRRAEFDGTSERLRAIQALAATGRRRFEPDLIRLAAGERDPLVRREILTALEALVPQDGWPAAAKNTSGEDRLTAWAARWEGPTGSSTMAAPDGAAGVRPASGPAAPEPPHDPGAVR